MSKPTGNPPGRPPKFSHPDEMEPLINAYFAKCDAGKPTKYFDKRAKKVITISEPIPYTMEKLSLALGFCSVTHMWEYIKKPIFTEVLTRAKTYIIGKYNENTMLGIYPPQFAPFYLCNIDSANYKPINRPEINIGIGIDLDKRLTQANSKLSQGLKDVTPKKIAEKRSNG